MVFLAGHAVLGASPVPETLPTRVWQTFLMMQINQRASVRRLGVASRLQQPAAGQQAPAGQQSAQPQPAAAAVPPAALEQPSAQEIQADQEPS